MNDKSLSAVSIILKRINLISIYIIYSTFYHYINKQISKKFFGRVNKLVRLQNKIINLKYEKDLKTNLIIMIFKKDKEMLFNEDRKLKNNIKN